jgi:hypothetical protein
MCYENPVLMAIKHNEFANRLKAKGVIVELKRKKRPCPRMLNVIKERKKMSERVFNSRWYPHFLSLSGLTLLFTWIYALFRPMGPVSGVILICSTGLWAFFVWCYMFKDVPDDEVDRILGRDKV